MRLSLVLRDKLGMLSTETIPSKTTSAETAAAEAEASKYKFGARG